MVEEMFNPKCNSLHNKWQMCIVFFVVVDFALLSYTRIKYFHVKKLKGTFKKKEEKLRR